MVIITTRDTHRLATYSEKELGIGSIASDLFPTDAFGGVGIREGGGRREKQLAWFAGFWGSLGQLLGSPSSSPGTALTWDFPPAPSTARVTERAQQMTWILKKEPKKLLQPRAIISCGTRAGLGAGGAGIGWQGADHTESATQAGSWASDMAYYYKAIHTQ